MRFMSRAIVMLTITAVATLLANNKQADEFAKYADFTIENITQVMQIIKSRNDE